jgi:hypothetical protein
MADTSFHAILKFLRNPRKNNGDAKYVSRKDNKIVFAIKELEQMIDNNSILLGKSIRVICSEFDNHMVASLRPYFSNNINDLIEPSDLNPFELQCEVVVDTANFLNSVVASGYTDPTEVMDTILDRFANKPKEVSFFYSPQEIKVLLNNFVFLSDIISKNGRPGWKLINAPEKIIINGDNDKIYKSNVDMTLAMYIAALTTRACLSHEGRVKTLIICSGDSDLAEASKLWLGMKGINDYCDLNEGRQLVIVSSVSANNLSSEMREVANHRNCQLILVEDL